MCVPLFRRVAARLLISCHARHLLPLPQAIRLYQNCLKKFHGGRDPSLHIYLAHAYFDARQYNDCMRVLLKALHVSPNNLQLWYNLALARETFAVAVLQKEQKGEARTLAEVENAIEDLKVLLSPMPAGVLAHTLCT